MQAIPSRIRGIYMANGKSTWILAALLIIVIVMAGVNIYYASMMTNTLNDISSKQTDILNALNITTAKPAITVYALWSGSEQHNFEQALGNFTQETGINVTYYGYTTQDLLISVPLQLKAPPYSVDVVIAPWPYWILQLTSYLAPVNNLINVTDYPANIISPVNDSSGNIWGAPFKLSGKPGFWYRPSFFAANNLTVPTTYDQLVNTLIPALKAIPGIEQPIASGDTVGWPLSDTTEAFIMGLGGYQLELQLEAGPSQRNWTDPQVVSVFTNLTQLLEAGDFSTPAEWTSQITKLWNGNYGIYWQGAFITTEPQVLNVSDFAFFGFPGTDGVVGAVDYITLPKYAPHAAEAQQLINYLEGPEAQQIMVQQGGFLATNLNVPASAYRPIDKTVVDFMAQPGISIVPDLDDTIGGAWQTTFWDQLKLLWTSPSTSTMNSVLNTLQTAAIQQEGA
jgi:multiple sugar transport system substrate-binding protein